MADKIKLVNPQKFDVGVRTQDRPMGMNIKAGSFVLVSTDDVSYISSISNIIQRGLLRIENLSGDTNDTAHEVEMSIGIDPEHDPHFSDDEDTNDDTDDLLSWTPLQEIIDAAPTLECQG